MSNSIDRDGGIGVRGHGSGAPIPLTTSQKSRLRRAFRDAYLIQDEAQRNHAITAVYFKFEDLYGISRDAVREIVEKVKREHRCEMHVPKPAAKPARAESGLTRWPWDPAFKPRRVPVQPPKQHQQRKSKQKINAVVAEQGKKMKKSSGGGPQRKKARFAICQECYREVLLVENGTVYEHWTVSGSRCPGTGLSPYKGPPQDECAVCGLIKPLRKTDGRVASHQAKGRTCEGSGKAPGRGRSTKYMKGTGASAVFSGGAPGLGKSRR